MAAPLTGSFFDSIGKFSELPYRIKKPSGQDHTAAERNIVAYAVSASLRSLLNECHWHSATRRRRRILQSRILF